MNYTKLSCKELIAICKKNGIKGYSKKRKQELIDLIETSNIKIVSNINISEMTQNPSDIAETDKNILTEEESTSLKERIEWALKKPDDIVKKKGITNKQQKEKLKNEEKEWGNKMIKQDGNGQWTTLLGEGLVRDVLRLRGENPRKPESKGGFQPDWETDECIYEVKTSNWWVDGTAGEKVLGTCIKYQDIPELYGKPLKIVCVAYQEEELTNGKTKYFGEKITKKTQQVLDLARSWNIEYVKFSDLASPILINNSL
jgi:hypothetical protein